MSQKPGTPKPAADRVVRDIRRKARKRHSTEEKIRIVLEVLCGDDSIATGWELPWHRRHEFQYETGSTKTLFQRWHAM